MTEPANVVESPVPSNALDFDRKASLILLIGLCCVGFFIADVATPVSFSDPIPALICMGVVTAQLTVICVWGTLVRGTFWIRLPWTLLLLIVSWCGLAWGIAIDKGQPDADAMLGAGLVWIFGFVTSFVPLKIAALCFRWQIVQHSLGDQNLRAKSSYAIRDIMIGTLLLALSMGIGRAMLPGQDLSLARAVEASGLDRPDILLPIVVFGFVSLLVKLPCIWISLGEKKEKIKFRIGLWCAYCLVLAIGEYALLTAILGGQVSENGEIFVGMIISHQLMGVIMLGICLSLRGLGYQLLRSRGRHSEHDAGDESESTVLVPESTNP